MKVLDLFSGIGGFSLGLERAGFETVAFCEIEPYCRKVLNKHWPDTPIHEDIRELDGTQYRGTVDVVCGGFPCQPFSVAGNRRGEADDRSLWPEMARVIHESLPAWVIAENVTGFASMGLPSCLNDLANMGYAPRTFCIPACAVGANHIRERLWIVAHSERELVREQPRRGIGQSGRDSSQPAFTCEAIRRPSEPMFCGTDDGIPNRVDRLRALGNAVVPQIPEILGRAIMEADHAQT